MGSGGMFAFLKTRTAIIISAVATGGISAGLLKEYMQGPKFTNPIRADDKVVIVTGANTGIGFETAHQLAKRGAHVYMACRNMKKCEEARREIVLGTKNQYVYCRECDLSSMESIKEFVKKFKKEQNRLDILINNAGVMRCPRTLTKEGIELQLGVNHVGHFLLTHLLLDLLKKSKPSRIVVVSSVAHHRGQINVSDLNSDKNYDPAEAYNQSKLANILFVRELAKRLHQSGVVVNAVHPGLVDTEIIRHMSVFKSLSGLLVKPLVWSFIKSAANGAQTTLYVALEPELGNKSGLYYSNLAKAEVSEAAKNQEIGLWLWKVTEKWTGIKEFGKID